MTAGLMWMGRLLAPIDVAEARLLQGEIGAGAVVHQRVSIDAEVTLPFRVIELGRLRPVGGVSPAQQLRHRGGKCTSVGTEPGTFVVRLVRLGPHLVSTAASATIQPLSPKR